MSKEYERHPLSKLCDDMTPEEWASFEANVARNGVKEPIKLYEGKVLDGWHRYRASRNNQLPCPEEQFSGTLDEAKELVRIAHNRRNWTPSQRALFEAEINAWIPAKGAPGAPLEDDAKTLSEQAADAQVSERTMQHARAVVRNAIPKVIDAVKQGDVSLKKAAAVAAKPKREQPKALKEAQAPKPRGAWRAADSAPLPRPQVGPSKDAYDEAMERVAILSEENDRLAVRCAVHFMEGTDDEKLAASVLLAELHSQVKTLNAELGAVKASRNSYMEECNELKKQCQMQRNQLQKFRDAK